MDLALVETPSEMLAMLEEFLALMVYLPLVPAFAAYSYQIVGCADSYRFFLWYFLLGLYYSLEYSSYYGMIHMIAALVGLLTDGLICMPNPQYLTLTASLQ